MTGGGRDHDCRPCSWARVLTRATTHATTHARRMMLEPAVGCWPTGKGWLGKQGLSKGCCVTAYQEVGAIVGMYVGKVHAFGVANLW